MRNGGDGDNAAALAQFLYPLGDQFLFDRLGIEFLDLLGDGALVGLDDLGQRIFRVIVTGLDAFQIHDAEAAELGHLNAETDVGDAVHRAGDDRDFQAQRLLAARARNLKRGIDLVGVDRDFSGNQRDFIESVGHPGLAIPSNPHSHVSSSPLRSCFRRAHRTADSAAVDTARARRRRSDKTHK